VNASWKDGTIVQSSEINVGLAVAIDDGLVVPVIHRADTLQLPELAARRADIVSRAQAGKLRPADIQGGGFTISNLGMFGVDAFSAIVNPPQAAILSVGAAIEKPVVKNGQIVPGLRMNIGVSADHRVVDGAVAASFLAEVKKLIENPALMLL
jgi:pyruvate dehydrogenase E2 component (dihydrolipoamide acetyltransferase)